MRGKNQLSVAGVGSRVYNSDELVQCVALGWDLLHAVG
jgi:hypothetical protein